MSTYFSMYQSFCGCSSYEGTSRALRFLVKVEIHDWI